MISKAEKFYQKGLYKQAEAVCTDILAKEPTHVDALRVKACTLLQTDRVSEGVTYLKTAISYEPKNADNLMAMGLYSVALKQTQQALNAYNQAYQIDNSKTEALFKVAEVYMNNYQYSKALAYLTGYINHHPEQNSVVKQIYVTCVTNVAFNNYTTEQKNSMEAVLNDFNISPLGMFPNWFWSLQKSPDYEHLAKAMHDPEFSDFDSLKAYLNSNYFVKGLERLELKSLPFEVFLTNLRSYLLSKAIEGDHFKLGDYAPFLHALSLQCWMNEYAYFISEKDYDDLAKLEIQLNSIDWNADDKDSIAMLMLYACFKTPCRLNDVEKKAKNLKGKSDGFLDRFLRCQIFDFFDEKKIKNTIKALTDIEDDVSQKVRDQYEENPYPRRNERYLLDPAKQAGGHKLDILFAGCGTGQQVLGFSQQYPQSKFTGVDLSTASLAYAIRQARRYKQTINYAQADILKLDQLPQKYDIIYCTGVLHHMDEPDLGLAVLKNILKPNGLMRLALYSETARKNIVAAQNYIKQNGYQSTNEDIRRFRHDMVNAYIKGDAPEFMDEIATISDFYGLSECRDLLFHVQEHRYTIPQLLDMLEQNDLEFVSFNIKSGVVLNKFAEAFPNGDKTDPMLWHEFEQQNPSTFLDMYNFDVRHKQESKSFVETWTKS